MEWINAKDKLPKKDEEVLFFYEWTGVSGTTYREFALDTINNLTPNFKPLYWMPIPDTPKEETP